MNYIECTILIVCTSIMNCFMYNLFLITPKTQIAQHYLLWFLLNVLLIIVTHDEINTKK